MLRTLLRSDRPGNGILVEDPSSAVGVGLAAGRERIRVADQASAERAVASLQDGDTSAMDTLYGLYFDYVCAYAQVALDDVHAAEDIAQQTFERAFRSIDRYTSQDGVPFRAWLFRIARNAIIDSRRRGSSTPWDPAMLADRQDDLVASDVAGGRDDAEHLPCPGGGAYSALRWITDHELALLVDRLPAPQRQALTLRYRLDLDTVEIAEMMGCTPRAVHDLEYRARRFLNTRLAGLDGSGSRGRQTNVRARLRRNPVLAQRRFALLGPAGGPQMRLAGTRQRGW
jgi:RNA polymerase sigma-70 factor (ECF subfamily)